MKLFFRHICCSIAIMLSGFCASALPVETYAEKSVLAEGKWVKISVSESGMHMIPTSTLRQWGFTSPSRVKVYGYGGCALNDVLNSATYIDDLPEAASVATPRGLVFYAVGPMQINMDDGGVLSHTVNPYSKFGYYFLTETSESSGSTVLTQYSETSELSEPETTAQVMLVHEKELVSPGASGRLMVGEDFNATRSRSFTFNLSGLWPKSETLVRTSFFANSNAQASILTFTANGKALESVPADKVDITTSGGGFWGNTNIISKTFTAESEKLTYGITMTNSSVVKSANLDYIEVIYCRTLSGSMDYHSVAREISHHNSTAEGTHVWDVTNPRKIISIKPNTSGGWRAQGSGARHYVVWRENENMPAPKKVQDVRNQNLHGIAEVPDMVIVAPDRYINAANQIAEIHRTYEAEPIKVEVTNLSSVLNEFGSGAFDPGALRRYFKMLYDRGVAAGTPLRYALMIGKGVCDNRQLTSIGRNVIQPMPLWVSEASLNESSSFSSDDYFALLTDNDGLRPAREDLDIAVGRIPATTEAEAQIAVDKIQQYIYSMPRDAWRSRITILADDENQGQHMLQSETMVENLEKGESGRRMVVNKVYCDAFTRQNSTYPKAKEQLFNSFADGTSVFVFIGHGSPTAIGSKIIIGPNDFREKFFLRKLPFFYAATCSFLEWDKDIVSQAESLMFQASGGIIGCISALRPVYITQNGTLTAAFGAVLGEFDDEGLVPTMGELYRRAKNRVNNDANKMRYVLMADPALRLSMPSAQVVLESINGEPVSAENLVTLMAHQKLEIKGRVVNPDGSAADDFDGVAQAILYDAEFSTTSHGWGDGAEVTFEQKGDMLFSVSGVVEKGKFSINVQMPSALADNYRPATLSLYAASTVKGDLREAVGLSRDVYAFGYDETTEADTEVPVIHSMTLNGDGFTNGGNVNENPLLMATVSDNVGLNLASAGIGKKMTLTIDGRETLNDVSRYFTPDPVATSGAMSGTIAYPLSGLTSGVRELRLRIWDIDGNFTDKTLICNVIEGLAPEIYEVYASSMTATSEAKFYVKHNRPDQMLKVKISVYNLLGTLIWSGESDARSNMGVSSPVVWDLKDNGGTRVARGIYVYRAEVTAEGSTSTTASRKLAVGNE